VAFGKKDTDQQKCTEPQQLVDLEAGDVVDEILRLQWTGLFRVLNELIDLFLNALVKNRVKINRNPKD